MNEEFLNQFGLRYNEKGILLLSGADLLDISKEFGTPLYVFSKDLFKKNINEFKSALNENFKNHFLLYASKALSIKEIYRILNVEGLGADVVSMGEILTALSVGFNPSLLYFHGNSKSDEDLTFAIEKGIKIVVDNESELNSIIRISKSIEKVSHILLRVKPGISPNTHSYIITGHLESKFGVSLEEGKNLLSIALKNRYIDFLGFHYHIGSQILDYDAFKKSAEEISLFLMGIKKELGYVPRELNVGGGFGIPYVPNDKRVDKKEFIRAIKDGLLTHIENLDDFKILIEPGRALIGDTGLILYRVLRKKFVNSKEYLFVDGGMGDNIRVPLYGARYTIANVKRREGKIKNYHIFGKYCESGDIVAFDTPLEEVEEGDYIAVFPAIAYTYSMASNYNRFTRPPVVIVENGKGRLVVRRETYEQLMQNDI
ncbi:MULTISPECIES: diaminopimelate decarboxylase [Caldisericum]|jgi:diaminopimelate decarboxylase|uniref:Diaminopimelate decarboxylase n=1 Tax=Caldisericum exile TaxID=693075 RepID=A0A2J6WFS1_9BACT|nr:MAG: diaminopimelate decarboxylase [Caldisericum exile]